MKTIHVYEKPMCCSTGICGPQVDPALPRFAADLDWLKSLGYSVERFNLGQQPQAFLNNTTVQQELMANEMASLPIIVVDGNIVSRGNYPGREQLAALVGVVALELPVVQAACCGSAPSSSAIVGLDEIATAKNKSGGCGCSESGCG